MTRTERQKRIEELRETCRPAKKYRESRKQPYPATEHEQRGEELLAALEALEERDALLDEAGEVLEPLANTACTYEYPACGWCSSCRARHLRERLMGEE